MQKRIVEKLACARVGDGAEREETEPSCVRLLV
jgi:hypothetical protein